MVRGETDLEEYEFGVLEDRIISLCEAARPDYEAICRQIEGGANVNAVNKYGQAFLSKYLGLAQPNIGEVPEGTSATYFEIVR